jgi:hypothetical protein
MRVLRLDVDLALKTAVGSVDTTDEMMVDDMAQRSAARSID